MREHNGWTNYATWRINLEFFDGTEDYWTAQSAEDYVTECLEQSGSDICLDYALSFISDVNWNEIAEHYQEPEEAESEDDESDDE